MSAIKLRISLCIFALVLYVALFNVYIAGMSYGIMPIKTYKLFYNSLSLGMLLFILLDWKAGFQNYLHQQLNLACILCLIIHYIIIILHWSIDCDTVFNFFTFNTSVALSGVLLAVTYLKSTWRQH